MSDIVLRPGAVTGTPKEIVLGDLSASRTSERIYLGGIGGALSLEAAWPEGDAVGALDVLVGNDPNSIEKYTSLPICALGTAEDPTDYAKAQPGGANDDGGIFLDQIETKAAYMVIKYNRTSGGMGIVPAVRVFCG